MADDGRKRKGGCERGKMGMRRFAEGEGNLPMQVGVCGRPSDLRAKGGTILLCPDQD